MDAVGGFLLLMAGLVFLMLFVLLFFALKRMLKLAFRLLINSVLGIAGIFLLGFVGISVPVNLATLLVVAVFGFAGLGALLILMFFGVNLA